MAKAPTPIPEMRNVRIFAKQNRTKVGKAIVAAGEVDFPVTATMAKGLKDLGLVEIIGIDEAPPAPAAGEASANPA